MARELTEQDCLKLAETGPAYNDVPHMMFPLWRSFILDEVDQAQIAIVEANAHSGNKSFYSLIGRITGIDSSMMDSICITGGVLSVIPVTTGEKFQEFLAARNSPRLQIDDFAKGLTAVDD